MDKREEEFLRKLRSTFKIEAEEHLRLMSSQLICLESDPTKDGREEALQTIYRAAHSLKGSSRAVNLRDVESICQLMESVLSMLKTDELKPSPGLFDTLHQSIGTLFQLVSDPESDVRFADLLSRLSDLVQAQTVPLRSSSRKRQEISDPQTIGAKIEPHPADDAHAESIQPAEATPAGEQLEPGRSVVHGMLKPFSHIDTIRISVRKLDSLLCQVEEMVSVKMATNQRVADLRSVMAAIDSWKRAWRKIYPELRNARKQTASVAEDDEIGKNSQELHRIVHFFENSQDCWKTIEEKVAALSKAAENEARTLSGMVDDLLEDMKNLLMLPFSTLLEVFPMLVRDLSRDQGKDVSLVVQGGDIEIDRRILEEMKDPLIHLVRNSLDHGIESPDERSQLGKQPNGTLTIAISQPNSNRIEILVSDDGSGIDIGKVKEAAVAKRMLSRREVQSLSDKEALSLIFRSEVSTASIITDLSGRGLGLAIVQEKVDKLGGNVSFESSQAQGTSFCISLPITLATFRGILVQVENRLVVIPSSSVERVIRIRRETIRTVKNRETIVMNGCVLFFVRLADLLEVTPTPDKKGSDLIPAVVLAAGQKVVAVAVDRVLSEQEVLVKNLGKQLSRVRNVTGATVLASGDVVPILNVSDLIKSAHRKSFFTTKSPSQTEEVDMRRRRILVAEDSITSRTLLKTILESAGYDVHTTVDGSDAWTALKTQDFDLLVSDVQMPRISGFELTSKIREDKALSDLPVVLVTSLESRQDREKGVDVGANAYIIKSSFEHSNLLEVVDRLI